MSEYNGNRILFTDKCIDKNGGYEVKGSECEYDAIISDYIIASYRKKLLQYL